MLSKLTEKTFSYEYFGEYFSNLEKSFENSNENIIFKIAKIWIPILGTTSVTIFIAINKNSFAKHSTENIIYISLIILLFILLYLLIFNKKFQKWYGLNIASLEETKFSENWYKKVRNEQIFVYNFLKLNDDKLDSLSAIEKTIIYDDIQDYVLKTIRKILIMKKEIQYNKKLSILIELLEDNLEKLKTKDIINKKVYDSYKDDLQKSKLKS